MTRARSPGGLPHRVLGAEHPAPGLARAPRSRRRCRAAPSRLSSSSRNSCTVQKSAPCVGQVGRAAVAELVVVDDGATRARRCPRCAGCSRGCSPARRAGRRAASARSEVARDPVPGLVAAEVDRPLPGRGGDVGRCSGHPVAFARGGTARCAVVVHTLAAKWSSGETFCVTSVFLLSGSRCDGGESGKVVPIEGRSTRGTRVTTGSDGDALALAPLTVPTIVDEVVDRLLTALALGEFVPGEGLPAEREMARLMGVSRTTVRVALARLRDAQVVEVRRGRAGGAFVTRSWQPESAAAVSRTLVPRRAEIEELGDLRCRYEEMVARTAAEVRTAAAADELLVLLDAFVRARTPQDEHRTDMALHEGVLRAAGNPQMAALSRDLLTRTSPGAADRALRPPHVRPGGRRPPRARPGHRRGAGRRGGRRRPWPLRHVGADAAECHVARGRERVVALTHGQLPQLRPPVDLHVDDVRRARPGRPAAPPPPA